MENQLDEHSKEATQRLCLKRFSSFRRTIRESRPETATHALNSELRQSSINFFDLLQKLKRNSVFRCFQIAIHRTGDKEFHNFYSDNISNRYYTESVYAFSNLKNYTKKSKNKFFNTNPNISFLGFNGNFSYHYHNIKNYSFFVLVSNNSFLPIDEGSYTNFKNGAEKVTSTIINLIEKFYESQKIAIIEESIKSCYSFFSVNDSESNTTLKHGIPIGEPLNLAIQDYQISRSFMNTNEIFSQFYHDKRISLLGELLDTLSHELCNPLLGIRLFCESLLHYNISAPVDDFANDIKQTAQRCENIIVNFSSLYNSAEKTSFSINSFIGELLSLAKSECKSVKRIINNKISDDLKITTHKIFLGQIILNLIINASQALNLSNTPSPTLFITIDQLDDALFINIANNGPSIDSCSPDMIFKPFFTTKENGTGLGLSISRHLAQRLGGQLCYKALDGMVNFELRLPGVINS